MQTLIVSGQKGGSGKTTVSAHLAVAASQAGVRVALIDADPQRSLADWAAHRADAGLPVVAAPTVAQVAAALDAAEADGYGLAIVDTPPHAGSWAAPILRRASLVLVPVRASVVDLRALPAALALVAAANVPAALVLSAVPAGVVELAEARRVLADAGPVVLAAQVGQRQVYARALAYGQAAAEFEPTGKAAREIRALWREVWALMTEGKQ